MVKDAQVKGLLRLMSSGTPLSRAAMKSGMSEVTARKYRKVGRLASEIRTPHEWHTRPDPFARVWSSEIEPLLSTNPGLQAKTVLEHLQERYPELGAGQLRTLQRRFREWRALHGEAKEVFFPQQHHPGVLGSSDFTQMRSLEIRVGGAPFDHLLYHFVLTYSNWEDVTVCFTESLESLSEGLQNALWRLGGVPAKHRTDCLTAAVNNLKDVREFTARYKAILAHYALSGQHTNPDSGHENGDVEQRHRRLRTAIDQALMLRGSRDFDSRGEYDGFLATILEKLNRGRRSRLAEEMALLRPLPRTRLPVYVELRQIPVSNASTLRVRCNVYSVHSRLRDEHVDVHLYADHLDVYYNRTFVERLPRCRGRARHRIDYRHVIDWLVRKPGAFADYRYRADLFPSSNFRIAYDMLREHDPCAADREYLAILQHAAQESETMTEKALELLIARGAALTGHVEVVELVRWLSEQSSTRSRVAQLGTVETVSLEQYDRLLVSAEVAR